MFRIELERTAMGSFVQNIWYSAVDVPSQTWKWLNGLNREEWMVMLVVICACGFVCLLGFQSKRI
jgi:hypothetical protein